MNRNLEIALRKQCEIAKVDFESIDFKEDGWFMKHTWTEAQQTEFKDWLVDFLKVRKNRGGIMSFPSLADKKSRETCASWFIFSYGFKTRNER